MWKTRPQIWWISSISLPCFVENVENSSTFCVENSKKQLALCKLWKTYPQNRWISPRVTCPVGEMVENLSTKLVDKLAGAVRLWKVWKNPSLLLKNKVQIGKDGSSIKLSTVIVDNLVENCAEVQEYR